MTAASPRRSDAVVFLAAFVLFVLLGFSPIGSYDYFWHLATGRWIHEHRALPFSDPFAVASDRIEWINGSWLFQWIAYLIYRAGDHVLVNVMRVAAVAATFATIATAIPRSAGAPLAVATTVLAFAGGAHRMGTRPETAGAICAVFATMLLLRERNRRRDVVLFTILTIVWANLHPSALLAPVMSALVAFASLLTRNERREMLPLVRMLLSAGALFVTPHGWKGVVAPFRLAAQVTEGKFVNLEWLPSTPLQFPFFYLSILVVAVILLTSRRRDWRRILLFAFFAALAARYVRNHGFFFATLPLLLAPELDRLRPLLSRRSLALATGALVLTAAMVTIPLPFDGGVDRELFPIRTTATLTRLGVGGTIYNPDQFGGYIIWSTYPARRALTDGRNELHATYLDAYERARKDNRAWRAFLDHYGVTAAVEEYRREPLEVIDPTSGRKTELAASLAFFPRREWALIDFDEVSMLFVKRSAVSEKALARVEFRELRPDLTSRAQVRDPARFLAELRAAAESGRAPRRLSALAERLSLTAGRR